MPEESKIVEVEASEKGSSVKECSSCQWWTRARPLPDETEVWGMEYFAFGECRGNPPTALSGDRKMQAINDPSGNTFITIKQARFPHTFPVDWCRVWTKRSGS